ncbi:Major facilitator superfamily transporter [Colletotrichum higginsianum IMI 349063]|uniref:Major facilitator superfamily transporter n=1 Tax=Colletotrichum higginsianum (strain IMI 349063) TaxID=759273 RepID=A0A1B7Y481_COLHI|nr:Major facilitator superfamily transporter [Colletotrichum higginsianum IMI 349063]OBR06774.1 Major facilitator superfamily transporter [Colletotrichum higginsianum IMI 349063]
MPAPRESVEDDRDGLPYLQRNRSSLSETVRRIGENEARSRYEARAEEQGLDEKKTASPNSSSNEDERTIISWDDGDPENPYNWSNTRKFLILCLTMMQVINSTMGSALPSNAIPFITAEWGVTNEQQKVLPISVFLIGYVFGPVVWAPLSEHLGRRTLTIITFVMFTIWTMACALAPNWPAFLIFRFLTGVFASSPIAIVAGILADIYGNTESRGRAMTAFMVTTAFGPLFAPIVSGFCSPTIGWRWSFWIALIYAGATLVPIILLPETYGPILLSRRARNMRKLDPSANIVAPREMERTDFKQLATVVLTRPMRMIIFEPIVSCTCAYLALVYTIFYMSFQAFPIIFQQLYGLSPGVAGLAYLPIGGGSLIAVPIFIGWEQGHLRAQRSGSEWAKQEEFRRLPLACIGGPLFFISLFWLGWSSREGISFVVPMLAGIPFGAGFMLIFIALLNYLTDAYEIFAASANAAASTSRSLLAVVLPLATTRMFHELGIAGACSLLGGLSAVMCIIPFIFIWKGEQIRAGSRFCLALRERKAEMERKVEEQKQKEEARRASRQSILPVPKAEV